jgi:precorrin-6B methylase 2
MFTRLAIPVVTAIAIVAVPLRSQERFSFFRASTPESVAQMLKLAALRDDDVVVDLGSGNGLIPLTAARMNSRLRGYGVDIDEKLVAESNAQAKKEGLADRVRFEHRNAFDADLREATVITMWLFPELMRLLRPVILERARPGTRVVTSTWDLGTWAPDATSTEGAAIFLWIVPARIGGGWNWDLEIGGTTVPYSAVFEQQFQKAEGVARAGNRREVLNEVTVRGASIQAKLDITIDGLGLTRHEFTGTVEGDAIAGTVQLTPANQPARTVPWRAQRSARPRYFEPTGTALLPRPGGTW